MDMELNKQKLSEWEDALHKLEGEWSYIVIKEKRIANAFVTPTCPRKIFIHEGFFDLLDPTDDELGLILSHEISHVILGHSTNQVINTTMISIVQLILLAFLDPTGLSSLFLEFLSFQTSFWLKASYSRQCEIEADELGLQIATQACFNTKEAVHFFQRLAAHEGNRTSRWRDTHPTSDERYLLLLEKASLHHTNEFHQKECNQIRNDFMASLEYFTQVSSSGR